MRASSKAGSWARSRWAAGCKNTKILAHSRSKRGTVDGGVTDQGHPYFVMELVRGIPITDYRDRAAWV